MDTDLVSCPEGGDHKWTLSMFVDLTIDCAKCYKTAHRQTLTNTHLAAAPIPVTLFEEGAMIFARPV